jgi:tetratricopeptide (TPR) repeat protein
LVLPAVGGCQTTATVTPAELLADYEAGRFQRSLDGAEQLGSRAAGRIRDEARYLAGMSAYRLGENVRAKGHLEPLADHADAEIAGPVNAALGFIAADRGDDARALAHMERAARRLSGGESARAHFHAGVLAQQLGRWHTARSHLSLAISRADDPALRYVARQRLETRGFALQFGAFAERDNAESAAVRLSRRLERAGIGHPKVVPSLTPRGERLYLVQAGWFDRYDDALDRDRALGDVDLLVVPVERRP